jgi:hypothetical protein
VTGFPKGGPGNRSPLALPHYLADSAHPGQFAAAARAPRPGRVSASWLVSRVDSEADTQVGDVQLSRVDHVGDLVDRVEHAADRGVGEPVHGGGERVGRAAQAVDHVADRGLDHAVDGLAAQDDRDGWPPLRKRLAETFRTRTRDEWCALLEGSDACFAPVLGLGEAPQHPHNRARQAFTELGGVVHPAPAPRLSRTPGTIPGPAPRAGEHTVSALSDWGFRADEVERLLAAGAVGQDPSGER